MAKTKTEKTNYLSFNNKFETVGSNGIFGASPSIVKFAGFESKQTTAYLAKKDLQNQGKKLVAKAVVDPTIKYGKEAFSNCCYSICYNNNF